MTLRSNVGFGIKFFALFALTYVCMICDFYHIKQKKKNYWFRCFLLDNYYVQFHSTITTSDVWFINYDLLNSICVRTSTQCTYIILQVAIFTKLSYIAFMVKYIYTRFDLILFKFYICFSLKLGVGPPYGRVILH